MLLLAKTNTQTVDNNGKKPSDYAKKDLDKDTLQKAEIICDILELRNTFKNYGKTKEYLTKIKNL